MKYLNYIQRDQFIKNLLKLVCTEATLYMVSRSNHFKGQYKNFYLSSPSLQYSASMAFPLL
jgi:hypothetical protein